MRVASRINEALRLKRTPPEPKAMMPVETAWYDELGISPTASFEDMKIRYLQHASKLEETLTYLLEAGETEIRGMLESGNTPDMIEDYGKDEEEDQVFDDGDERNLLVEGDSEDEWSEDEEEEEEDKAALIRAQTQDGSLMLDEGDKESEIAEETNQVLAQFTRVSNIFQILSVPRLRRIYDDNGIEGLVAKSPQLSKGLLEPEKVLLMARGQDFVDPPPSLLLQKMPRLPGFFRYQAANSIRQVLKRLTDVELVWTFQTRESLQNREGTIYPELPEIGIFGRANSGKSALIRHMFHGGNLQGRNMAMSSSAPGKTRGLNVYAVNRRFTITDAPGYGSDSTKHESAKKAYRDWKEHSEPLVAEYLNSTRWMRAAIYTHEISKDATDADREFLDMLRSRDIPILLVLTKDDKVDSEPHRLSRVRLVRKQLDWPKDLPHTFYNARGSGYGQLFKNMLGTMMLGLLSSADREDAWDILRNDCAEVFHDYRDKWVPINKKIKAQMPLEKKSRRYPDEDKAYTQEDLDREDRIVTAEEKRQKREEMNAMGIRRTLKDDVEEEAGQMLTPKERRQRWAELLAKSGTVSPERQQELEERRR